MAGSIAEHRRSLPRNAWGIPQNVGPVDRVLRSAAGGGMIGYARGVHRSLWFPLRILLALSGATLIVEAMLGF